MSGIEIALMAIGTAVSVAGAVQAGKQQKAMAQYNARIAGNQAVASTQAAVFDADKERENTRRLLSTQRARYAAAGVTFAGSPLLVMQQTAADAELDAQAIEYGGEMRAAGYQSQAAMDVYEGQSAYQAGLIKAGTSLLTGASRTYGAYTGRSGITVGSRTSDDVTRYNQPMRVK